MTRKEHPTAGSAEDWLRLAQGDMNLARAGRSCDVPLEMLCFLVQQAVEKAIKAMLMSRCTSFPRTHNIGALLRLLPPDVALPFADSAAARLSDYAVSTRYPGEYEPIEMKEYDEALDLAAQVLQWAVHLVSVKRAP